jgi:hypothetical protein
MHEWLVSISNPLNEVIERLRSPNQIFEFHESIADLLAPLVAEDLEHPAVMPDQRVQKFLVEQHHRMNCSTCFFSI